MIYLENTVTEEWREYILILPAVAVGNVGQLAIDALIANLNVKHIGYIHHPCILPVIGSDPFDTDSTKLVTSCHVYECQDKKLVIMQQRSPIVHGKEKEYIDLVLNWIAEKQFKMVVMLSSSFSQFFVAEELQRTPMHYLCTSKVELPVQELFQRFKWERFNSGTRVEPSGKFHISGGGVSRLFLEMCDQKGVSLVMLICVCSEGNNYPEAMNMINCLQKWLKFAMETEELNWNYPASWKLPYGGSFPQSIY